MWPREVGHDVHAWADRLVAALGSRQVWRRADTEPTTITTRTTCRFALVTSSPTTYPKLLHDPDPECPPQPGLESTGPDFMLTMPAVPKAPYRDGFGNWCTRLVAPAGKFSDERRDRQRQAARRTRRAVRDSARRPAAAGGTLVFLLGSRYCETDKLSELPGACSRARPSGWARVQAICDFVHQHIQFGYQFASPTKTAWDVFEERRGVCRDFAHLAITLCRCMNIPARYCTGYLGDIGRPAGSVPMDFAAGSRPIWAEPGTRSIRETTSRASDACSSRAAATPPTSRSRPRLDPTR